MFISIIIPAYNIKDYLERCVSSVMGQQFTDFEVIIVDDGSRDETGKIADMLVRKAGENNVYALHQENKGLGGARNTGIKHARGEYVMFLDGDDMLFPGALQTIYDALQKTKSDIICFDYYGVNEKKLEVFLKNDKLFCKQELENQPIDVSKKDYLVNCGVSACNKVYKRTLFNHKELFFPERLLYEDLATTPKLVMYADRIVKIPNPLYLYITRRGSITTNPKMDRLLEPMAGFDGVINQFKKNNLLYDYYEELEWISILHCFYYTMDRYLYIDYKKAVVNKIEKYLSDRFPNYKNNKYLLKNIKEGTYTNLDKYITNRYSDIIVKRRIMSYVIKIYLSCRTLLSH